MSVNEKDIFFPVSFIVMRIEYFRKIIKRCLEKVPGHRYQHPMEIVADIENEKATSAPLITQTKRFIKRAVPLAVLMVFLGLILYFLAANSWQCATLFYVGLINGDVLRFALYMLPAFIIGNMIGSIWHIKINQVLFHKVVALVLLIAGLFLMIPRPSPDVKENLAVKSGNIITQITGGQNVR